MSPVRSSVHLFQSILCPVDFSTNSTVALQHAAAIARRSGGRLTAMYADDPMLAAAAAAGYNQKLLTKQTTSALRRLLTSIGIPLDREPAAAGIVCAIGRPAREILNVARRIDADLIVMGTQGLSGVGRMFFGSVTEKVLRRTTVPVLAVPSGVGARRLKSWPDRPILCAVEFGPRDREDVRMAAEIARVFATDLILIHVVAATAGPPWLISKLGRRDRVRLRAARARLEQLAGSVRRAAGIPVESRALLGRPAEEIAAAAAEMSADLIVLTLRSGHGLFGLRQGTITYQVLCGAGTPVLALQQRPRRSRK
jgi:nucleotide-binding universal stress UspA family protein